MLNRINQLFQDSPKNLLSIYFCCLISQMSFRYT